MSQKPSRRFDKGARVWGCYFGSPRHQTTSPSLVHFFVDFCCQVLSIAVDIEDRNNKAQPHSQSKWDVQVGVEANPWHGCSDWFLLHAFTEHLRLARCFANSERKPVAFSSVHLLQVKFGAWALMESSNHTRRRFWVVRTLYQRPKLKLTQSTHLNELLIFI